MTKTKTKTKTIESKRKANKQLLSKLFVYKAFVKILKKKRLLKICCKVIF